MPYKDPQKRRECSRASRARYYLKNQNKYYCNLCNTGCSKLSDYNRHIATKKHKQKVSNDNNKKTSDKNGNKTSSFDWSSYKGERKKPHFNILYKSIFR